MAALAFTAYGVHWFALGLGRTFGGDPRPNAMMATERALGLVHIAVGAWLMYLTVAAALNLARGFNLPL